jgi:hypothetical protein
MAAALENLAPLIGLQVPGSHLVIVADAGKDATRHRMVRTECLLCGVEKRQRLSNIRGGNSSSCGCQEKQAFIAYHQKNAQGLSKEKVEGIYVAMITGQLNGEFIRGKSTRLAIANHYGLEVATVDFAFRALRAKVEALAAQIHKAAQQGATKLQELASQFGLPQVAIRQAVSYFNKLKQAAVEAAKQSASQAKAEVDWFVSQMKTAVASGREKWNGVLDDRELQRTKKSYFGDIVKIDEGITLEQYPIEHRATVLEFRDLVNRTYAKRAENKASFLRRLRAKTAESLTFSLAA